MGLNLQKRIRSQGTLETGFIVNKQQLVNTEGKIYSLVQHCDLVAPIVLILRRSIEKQILYISLLGRFAPIFYLNCEHVLLFTF